MVIVATLLIHLGDSRLNAAVPINSRFQSRGSSRQLRPLWQDYLRSLQANRADNADQVAPSDCGEPNIGFGSSSVGAEEAES